MADRAEFDEFAATYESTMERACAIAGESNDFYAFGRLQWCRRRLSSHLPVHTVLDFGCGIGGSFEYFFDLLGCNTVIGLDPSIESLRIAKDKHPGLTLQLGTPEDFVPDGSIPLAFCNGVFHHIPPAARQSSLSLIRRALSKDGILAFWENNPWNPIVTYAMSLNEFDRNAEVLSPRHSVRLLKEAGFHIISTDYCFFFPHFASRLRFLEPALRWLPLGAQYLVLARKG
jgi:SAM-dependent methyltransferase